MHRHVVGGGVAVLVVYRSHEVGDEGVQLCNVMARGAGRVGHLLCVCVCVFFFFGMYPSVPCACTRVYVCVVCVSVCVCVRACLSMDAFLVHAVFMLPLVLRAFLLDFH